MAEHIPVMLQEVIEGLNIKPNGIYLDLTLGRAGHSSVILSKLNKEGLLIGVVLSTWFAYLVNIVLVSKYIGYKWIRQIVDILPFLLVSSISALISYLSVQPFHLDMYIDGLLKFLVYSVCYLGWSFIFKPDAYNYLTNTMTEVLYGKKNVN